MPVYRHKKDATPKTLGSTQEQTSPPLPDRYRRYEPHIAEGLTHMFVAGTSTHKV